MAPASEESRKLGPNSLGVRLWNWAVNAWPIGLPPDRPNPATEMLTQTKPPSWETPPPAAVTCGKSSDNAELSTIFWQIRPFIFSAHRPSRVRFEKKVRRDKKSLNRSINGRKEKSEIRSFARVKVSFHSGRAKIIMVEDGNRGRGKNRYRIFEIYKMSIVCENGSFSSPPDRNEAFELFFLEYSRVEYVFNAIVSFTKVRCSPFYTTRIKIRSRAQQGGGRDFDRRPLVSSSSPVTRLPECGGA